MYTFDAWEAAIRPPEDYLMHFRTPGSKNGVRKYQNPDGTWTELGLQERAKREGWDHEKEVRKAQKQAAKLERKQAKQEARAQKQFERSEQKRKSKLSGLTDKEMADKLKRAKMEAEYRELTKKDHAVLEAGSKLVNKILDYKQNKDMRVLELNKQKIEIMKIKAEQKLAEEQTKRTMEQTKQTEQAAIKAQHESAGKAAEARAAEAEARRMEADVKGGLAIKRKADLKRAKKEYRETTVGGAIGKFFNSKAKGSGEAAGEKKKIRNEERRSDLESKKRRQRTDDIIRNEEKTGKYNVKAAKKGWGKMESTWSREKHDKDRDAKKDIKLQDSRTKAEEWRAKQEEYKWKAKVGRKS